MAEGCICRQGLDVSEVGVLIQEKYLMCIAGEAETVEYTRKMLISDHIKTRVDTI